MKRYLPLLVTLLHTYSYAQTITEKVAIGYVDSLVANKFLTEKGKTLFLSDINAGKIEVNLCTISKENFSSRQ